MISNKSEKARVAAQSKGVARGADDVAACKKIEGTMCRSVTALMSTAAGLLQRRKGLWFVPTEAERDAARVNLRSIFSANGLVYDDAPDAALVTVASAPESIDPPATVNAPAE